METGSSTQYQNTRRSQRLMMKIAVYVECLIEKHGRFAAEAVTVVINAHGGLLRLPWELPLDQELQLQNLATEEWQTATVAYVHPRTDGIFDVGVDFTQPNPKFWGVSFPPEDWSPSHPDAKKDLEMPWQC